MDGERTKRCKQVLLNLRKFCDLYKMAGKTFINKDLLSQTAKIVNEMPEL